MHLIDNRKEHTIPFKTIKIGETFYDSENDIHAMRISACEDAHGHINATDLQRGTTLYYEDDEGVIATKARIEVYA